MDANGYIMPLCTCLNPSQNTDSLETSEAYGSSMPVHWEKLSGMVNLIVSSLVLEHFSNWTDHHQLGFVFEFDNYKMQIR